MKTYDCVYDYCNLIKLFCLGIVISFFMFIYYKTPYNFNLVYITLFIVVFSYFINTLIHHFIFFFLLHIGMIASLFLFELDYKSIAYCIALLITVVLIDFVYWFSNHENRTCNIPLGFLVIFVIIYIYAENRDATIYTGYVYYLGQFYILASLLSMYIVNIHFLPSDDGENALKPKKSVLTRNNTYIIVILSGILLFNVIVHLKFLEDFLNYLVQKIGSLMRIVLGEIFPSEQAIPIVEETTDQAMQLPPSGESNLIALIIGFLMCTAAVAFLLFIAYLAIRKIVDMIKNHLYRTSRKKVAIDETYVEVSENLKVSRHHRKSGLKFGSDLRERIRKHYYQEVKHQMKRGYENRDTYTPNERSEQLQKEKNVDIDQLTYYYNIARYSDHPITSKEFHSIK